MNEPDRRRHRVRGLLARLTWPLRRRTEWTEQDQTAFEVWVDVKRGDAMKRLLVTGSREWTDREKIVTELERARVELGDNTTLVHGDARGVDRIAAHLWHCTWGLPAEDYPADWYAPCRAECKPNHRRARVPGGRTMCPAAGMYRNAGMVALGADLCLAFILDRSAGASGCARLARKAGIPVRTFAAVSS